MLTYIRQVHVYTLRVNINNAYRCDLHVDAYVLCVTFCLVHVTHISVKGIRIMHK